ncbi:MAG TPA: acyl-CoA dehydrogenase family protein [Candidatus Dormibacteraeota bacterium]|jgi:alkylation response protein AidB-like acyl-CoA dehydrogenase|nr:acyl-CoA dehydrogenase family protein [Candidatus Dormibacteraeota bacterium]
MDFSLTTEQARFRDELRAWLRDNLADAQSAPMAAMGAEDGVERRRSWQRRVYEAGYAGVAWPKEYGGRGLSLIESMIVMEEMSKAKAPDMINVIGLNMAGPTIIHHGTPAQKERHLRGILDASEIWCQGFSEPNSGSDLASLQTRAVLDGDDFVVNGQKVWTTLGHVAKWCILLTRTGSADEKHSGLTYLIVDMKSPGVEVKPLVQMTGDAEFNEIYFTDVRVPRENLLGGVGEGWRVAMTTLMHERATLGVALQVRSRIAFDELITLVRAAHGASGDGEAEGEGALVRQKLAQLYIDTEAMRCNGYRGLTRMLRGETPGPEGSINKLMWSEVNQRLMETALEVEGPAGMLAEGEPSAPDGGRWTYQFLRSRANSIEGGTSEVLRNILAERVLGLPRSR